MLYIFLLKSSFSLSREQQEQPQTIFIVFIYNKEKMFAHFFSTNKAWNKSNERFYSQK